MSLPDLYLASASPRRRELLAQIGLTVELIPQSMLEQRLDTESPESYVKRLAIEKAKAGSDALGDNGQRPVLGADTAVVLGDTVLGKPVDKADALAMLGLLSGQVHRVLSAVAVVGKDNLGQNKTLVSMSESHVRFRRLSETERLAYWQTGEPVDKAGGYGIQGLGAMFIEHLEGSYSGVMGLPLFETAELLQQFDIELLVDTDKGNDKDN